MVTLVHVLTLLTKFTPLVADLFMGSFSFLSGLKKGDHDAKFSL